MAIRLRLLSGIVAWAAALWGSLQVSHLHTSWDHAICGVWGCGPTLSALVSCHLAWLVVLLPVALAGRQIVPENWRRPIGVATFVLSLSLLLGVVTREAVDWLPSVGPGAGKYFVQRCLFVVATWIDFPVVQLGLLSLLWWRGPQVVGSHAKAKYRDHDADWQPPFELRNGYDHDPSQV